MTDNIFCSIPVSHSAATLGTIEARCNARIQDGIVKEADVSNIRNRTLDLIPKDLSVNAVTLEKLRRLCQLWEVDIRVSEITSHRKYIGPVVVKVKKMLFPIIRFFMKDLIREQRDFNAASIELLAELCNQTSEKIKKGDR